MKIANLWLFFYNGGAPVVVEQEDSRGWRYHAHAAATKLATVAVHRARTHVVAAVTARTNTFRVPVSFTHARVTAASVSRAQASTSRVMLRPVRVISDARSAVSSLALQRVMVKPVAVTSHAQSRATSRLLHTRLGRVTVQIGPDLVEQELEEIMFLLEVA